MLLLGPCPPPSKMVRQAQGPSRRASRRCSTCTRLATLSDRPARLIRRGTTACHRIHGRSCFVPSLKNAGKIRPYPMRPSGSTPPSYYSRCFGPSWPVRVSVCHSPPFAIVCPLLLLLLLCILQFLAQSIHAYRTLCMRPSAV